MQIEAAPALPGRLLETLPEALSQAVARMRVSHLLFQIMAVIQRQNAAPCTEDAEQAFVNDGLEIKQALNTLGTKHFQRAMFRQRKLRRASRRVTHASEN